MPKKKTMSKADFVRSLPNDLPVREVLAKAKEAGLSISETYAYGVRAAGKNKGAKGAKGVRKGRSVLVSRSSGAVEGQFLDLVLDIGLVRAQQLLSDVKSRVSARN